MERIEITAIDDNSLRKLGAVLRWMIEKSKVDPEASSAEHAAGVVVSIAVNTDRDQRAIMATLLREFDAEVMHREEQNPHCVRVFGVWICVLTKNKPKEIG